MYSLKRHKIEINANLESKIENFSFVQRYRVISKSQDVKNIIDKLVLEIAESESKQLGIDMNDSNITIEYWCKNFEGKNTEFNVHFDKNEYVLNEFVKGDNNKLKETDIFPLGTMVLYFDDIKDPLIITNIERNKCVELKPEREAIYHCSNAQPVISYIFPRKYEIFSFNGGIYLHGATSFSKSGKTKLRRRIIAINIWNSSYHKKRLINNNLINDKDSCYLNTKYKLEAGEKVLNNIKYIERDGKNNIIEYTNDKKLITKVLQNRSFREVFKGCDYWLNTNYHENIYSIAYSMKTPYSYDKDFNFHLITVSSDISHPGYKDFIETVKYNKIPHTVLGLDVEWRGTNMEGPGGGQKINLLKEELSKWSEEKLSTTIVLFTDSYDVLILGNIEEIKKKYYEAMQLYKQMNSVLFAAEVDCWPNKNLSKYYRNHFDSSYLYLNSGCFIGVGSNVYSLIKDSNVKDYEDDQLYYTKQYLNVCHKKTISIDYMCRLFQTLNNSLCNINICSKGIFNVALSCRPLILHGNGDKDIKEKLRFIWNILKNRINKVKYKNHSYLIFHPLYQIEELKIFCYIITLKRSVKRRELMEKKIKRNTGIVNYEYYYGVDGNTDLNSYRFKVSEETSMLVGEIGCFLSHYNLWLELKNKSDNYFLILEDDNTFYLNFNYYMNKLLTDYLPMLEEYDVIKCDNFIHANKSYYEPINNDMKLVKRSINFNSYVITKKGINKMIESDCLNNLGPVDVIINKYLNVATFKYAISDQEPRPFIKSEIEGSSVFNDFQKKQTNL